MGKLGAEFRQAHLTGNDLVASRSAEFLKPRRGLALLLRTLVGRHLGDHVHRGQYRDAAFKTLGDLVTFVGKTELAVLA